MGVRDIVHNLLNTKTIFFTGKFNKGLTSIRVELYTIVGKI